MAEPGPQFDYGDLVSEEPEIKNKPEDKGDYLTDNLISSLHKSNEAALNAQRQGHPPESIHFSKENKPFIEHTSGDYVGRYHADDFPKEMRVYHKDFPEVVLGFLSVDRQSSKHMVRQANHPNPTYRTEIAKPGTSTRRHALMQEELDRFTSSGKGLQTDRVHPEGTYNDTENYHFK